MQCLHILNEMQLSLNPPSERLPRLSADTTATVPYITIRVQTQSPFPVDIIDLLRHEASVLTSFFISSINGFSKASIPCIEMKVDFARANRCMLEIFDLYFGDKLPRVK